MKIIYVSCCTSARASQQGSLWALAAVFQPNSALAAAAAVAAAELTQSVRLLLHLRISFMLLKLIIIYLKTHEWLVRLLLLHM